jgi:hypothetical protein
MAKLNFPDYFFFKSIEKTFRETKNINRSECDKITNIGLKQLGNAKIIK